MVAIASVKSIQNKKWTLKVIFGFVLLIMCGLILQTKNTNVNSGNVNSHRTDCAEVRKEKYWIISWWITALGQFIPAVKSRKINDQPKLSWEPENINMIYFIHRILGKENEGGSHTTFLNYFYHEDYHCWLLVKR